MGSLSEADAGVAEPGSVWGRGCRVVRVVGGQGALGVQAERDPRVTHAVLGGLCGALLLGGRGF